MAGKGKKGGYMCEKCGFSAAKLGSHCGGPMKRC